MGKSASQAPLNGVAALYHARQKAQDGAWPDDKEFSERWPSLFSIMCNNRLDPKHWTDPARLSISNSCGDWLIGLSVPGLAAFTQVMARTVNAGLDALEKGLFDGTVQWTFNLKRPAKVRKVEEPKNQT
jgi:hypothetical protein